MGTHCKECGSEKSGNEINQKGSDNIPLFECPDCGDVAAIGCSCGDPDSHSESGA